MTRYTRAAQVAVILLLIGSLLAACRVTEVPSTVYPGPDVASYPGPQSPATARPAATRQLTKAAVTALPPTQAAAVTARPTQAPAPSSPAPAATVEVGEADLSLTLLHTGEVQGEVVPCG